MTFLQKSPLSGKHQLLPWFIIVSSVFGIWPLLNLDDLLLSELYPTQQMVLNLGTVCSQFWTEF